jgi:hypothetical protein
VAPTPISVDVAPTPISVDVAPSPISVDVAPTPISVDVAPTLIPVMWEKYKPKLRVTEKAPERMLGSKRQEMTGDNYIKRSFITCTSPNVIRVMKRATI